MVLSGEAKRVYMRTYRTGYMRGYRKGLRRRDPVETHTQNAGTPSRDPKTKGVSVETPIAASSAGKPTPVIVPVIALAAPNYDHHIHKEGDLVRYYDDKLGRWIVGTLTPEIITSKMQ